MNMSQAIWNTSTPKAAAAALFLAAITLAPAAHANPGSNCGFRDVRLRDPSKAYYCPATGQIGTWMTPCSTYVTGPYAPGGPLPNGDDD